VLNSAFSPASAQRLDRRSPLLGSDEVNHGSEVLTLNFLFSQRMIGDERVLLILRYFGQIAIFVPRVTARRSLAERQLIGRLRSGLHWANRLFERLADPICSG
jgi:hypothetical protein